VSVSDLAIVAALVFAWGTLSARLERFDVTAPITFVLAGLLLTHGPLGVLSVAPAPELVKVLAEVTLVLVLFSDASRVGLRELRADAGLYARLLGVGLPLTIGLGTLLALALFHGMSIWLALLVGAALAPTDAALGAGMIVNPAVPARIRRLVNVESGLNDGIATPFVLVAVAGAQSAGHAAGARLGRAAVVLVGWFGPRGLASVVFALLALEEIGQPAASQAVAVITVTVLLSVVAHGATADPLARRFGPRLAPPAGAAEHADMPDVPERRPRWAPPRQPRRPAPLRSPRPPPRR
jgi:sodium/hydrogen antiporter